MICTSCKTAADLTINSDSDTELYRNIVQAMLNLGIYTDEPKVELLAVRNYLHTNCKGKTACDCQHRVS